MDPDQTRTHDSEARAAAWVLDDPAWFGATMGTGAVGAVAALNPGRTSVLEVPSQLLGVVLTFLSTLVFVFLYVRDFGFRGMGRTLHAQLRSPLTGAANATIPGAINVIAVAAIQLWPTLVNSAVGW